MKRNLPTLAGLVVVLGAGLVHGLWTGRWREPPDLGEVSSRLERVPGRLGPWTASPYPLEAWAVRQARAGVWWGRRYADPRRRAEVTVILLGGPPGPMAAHRPEYCYRGSGYEMTAPAAKVQFHAAPGFPGAGFWAAEFTREEAGGAERERVFWAWNGGAGWQASGSPRTQFHHLPVLYKLYVIHTLGDRPEGLAQDPALDLLTRLIPELGKALSPGPDGVR